MIKKQYKNETLLIAFLIILIVIFVISIFTNKNQDFVGKAITPAELSPEICNNNIDDNGNRIIDCEEFSCIVNKGPNNKICCYDDEIVKCSMD
mgnify:CR=1 FL=1